MKLFSQSFKKNSYLHDKYTLNSNISISNLNPHLGWEDIPKDTKSFALLMSDPDVPSDKNMILDSSQSIPSSAPRSTMYHWVLYNIPISICEIKEAENSENFLIGGKKDIYHKYGVSGINDYTKWFSDDDIMRGNYYGYDGPCPPPHDEKIHSYIFTLYALNTEEIIFTEEAVTGDILKCKISPFIIEEVSISAQYSNNTNLILNIN